MGLFLHVEAKTQQMGEEARIIYRCGYFLRANISRLLYFPVKDTYCISRKIISWITAMVGFEYNHT